MKPKKIELKDYINNIRRKVQLENLNAKQGFTFEDDKLLAIRRKIEAAGVPLGEIEGTKIMLGMNIGSAKSFLMDEEVYLTISRRKESYKNVLSPIIKGENLGRYVKNYKRDYVINFHKGFTNENRGGTPADKYINEEYGDIIEYMTSQHKVSNDSRTVGDDYGLTDRVNCGDYWWEMRGSTLGEIFRGDRIEVSKVFSKKGIYYEEINKNIIFDASVFGIKCRNTPGVCALMNSNIVTRYCEKFIISAKLGETYVWNKSTLEEITIPEQVYRLNKFTPEIQALKKEGKPTEHLEAEVEKIVQELYGLTDEEVEYLCKE